MAEISIGEKIKAFRNDVGVSQLDLELAIGTSPGCISRIENGRVNPTKETIIDISKALKLETPQIASLFGIDYKDPAALFDVATDILSAETLEDVLAKTVNDLILKLGYLASVIFLVKNDDLCAAALTNSNISKKVFSCLDRPFSEFRLSLSNDLENLTVKCTLDKKTYLTYLTREYLCPGVSQDLADKLQEVSGDKSHLLVPLEYEGNIIGVIVYIKKIKSDFEGERELLCQITKQVAIAIGEKFEV
ncbi:helix-turn-helix domain-containing protein [Candidatus Dojkabacteria bacterium]|nr:helix-turn-helix domain-containing protein [Candidatus Dojkabacteria bacterium]